MKALCWILSLVGSSAFQSSISRSSPHATTTARCAATRLHDDDVSTNDNDGLQQSPMVDMKAYASGYTTAFQELPYEVCSTVTGQVPNDLVGSYFRAGPSMFSAGSIVPPKTSIVQPRQPPVPDGQDEERMVRHPMEGDGAVFAITFGEDKVVSARFRFVRTVGFTNERKKGARIYKALDSTRNDPSFVPNANDMPLPLIRHHLQPGLNKQRKNTSNTRAIFWGNRLLTLWEGGQPYKLDARALDTEGRSRLGGAIRRDDDPFGGKVSIDAQQQRALFYGIEHGAKSTDVTLYEFDDSFALVDRSTTTLPGFAAITDFATTQNFAVFVQPNIQLNAMQFIMSKDPAKILQGRTSQPGTLHLIPRTGSQKSQVSVVLPSVGPSDSNAQFVNAYEEGSNVIVDVILSDDSKAKPPTAASQKWPWGTTMEDYQSAVSKKSLWRYSVDIPSGRVEKTLLMDHHCFFGTVNPAVSSQRHRYIYAAAGALGDMVAPPQGILRYDCDTGVVSKWIPESHEFCGEPVYAPRQGASGEDSGYILSLLYNGKTQKSEVVILKANDVAAGPVARIQISIPIPHGLFGCFSESAVWPADSLERRAKLADKVESRGNRWNEVKSDFSGLGLRLDDMEEYFGDFFN